MHLGRNRVHDLTPLQDLTQLESLHLGRNKVQDFSCLANVSQLTRLSMGRNKLKDFTFLQSLQNLKELHLNYNKIHHIDFLEGLSQLTILDLNGNEINNISPLQGFTQLTELDLSGNQIQDISCIQYFTQLQELSLHSNKISKIPSVNHLKHLAKLNLSSNQISTMSSLEGLTQLAWIDLRNNKITHIPARLLHTFPKLQRLYLWRNPIQNIPKEIFENVGDNVLEQVYDYLNSIAQQEDRRELNEAKILLVGVGEVGKTELAEAISTTAPEYTFAAGRETTKGIRIKSWKPAGCVRKGKKINFTANIWDFAGQEVNYGTHQFFLTKNSIYLFVWETRKGEDQSKFGYWLNIVSLLSDNAPILVVQNKVDIYESEINQKDWKARFPNIAGFYKTSCKEGTGIEILKKSLKQALLAIPNTLEIWNKNRFAVRKALEQRREEYISYREYLHICTQHNLSKEQAGFLSRQLHDIGVILHFGQSIALKNTLVLKPDWATRAAYYLLDTKKITQGKFHPEELDTIWEEECFAEKHLFLLHLMERFELIFRLQGSEEYIIPELLPIESPQEIARFSTVQNAAKHLRFEYHYQFMPKGILGRFICRIHELIEGTLFWKYGVLLTYKDSRAQVLLNDVALVIQAEVWGKQADTLLSIIRMHFDHLHQKLHHPPLREVIPCYCEKCQTAEKQTDFFEYDYLKMCLEEGDTELRCQNRTKVSIQKLLEGILATEQETIQRLLRLVEEDNMADFFEELQHMEVQDHLLAQLRNRYVHDGGDFRYADQLKVWVIDYFK